jgi:hypothetical protein
MDTLTLEAIKEKILELEEDYTEAAKSLNKVWAPYSVMDKLKQLLIEAEDEVEVCKLLLTLEEGFSNPMSFKSAEGITLNTNMDVDNESQSYASNKDFTMTNKIIEDDLLFYRNNRKIKKFWSSDALKDSWKDYISSIQPGSISALFLSVCVFIDQAEAYIEKLNLKFEKKKEVDERSNIQSKRSSKASERNDRKRKAGFYKEESSEEESEASSDKPRKTKRQKVDHESEFEDESMGQDSDEEAEDDAEDEEMEDDDSQWDSNCYI